MNPKFRQYKDYGGRGISIHPDWIGRGGFQSFLSEIGPRPSPNHTLDRIDNNKGYVPGNIRWATRTIQNRNASKNVFLTDGVTKTIAEWVLETGLCHSTIRYRLSLGWSDERVLFTPLGPTGGYSRRRKG